MKITLEGSGDSIIATWLVDALDEFNAINCVKGPERIIKVKSIEFPAGLRLNVLVKWFTEPDEETVAAMDEAIGQHAPTEMRQGEMSLCYDHVCHEWPGGAV